MKTVGFIAPTAICRHSAKDPDCSSNKSTYYYEETVQKPDSAKYSIEAVERVGKHLVMKVLYPNCRSCAYEGNKILVFLNVDEFAALKWKKIDPHFTDPKNVRPPTEAPSPAARFPASGVGWTDAITYARSKT